MWRDHKLHSTYRPSSGPPAGCSRDGTLMGAASITYGYHLDYKWLQAFGWFAAAGELGHRSARSHIIRQARPLVVVWLLGARSLCPSVTWSLGGVRAWGRGGVGEVWRGGSAVLDPGLFGR